MIDRNSIKLNEHFETGIKPRSFVGKQVVFVHPMLSLYRIGTVVALGRSDSFWIEYKDDEYVVSFENCYLTQDHATHAAA